MLLSGGLDSYTAAAIAREQGFATGRSMRVSWRPLLVLPARSVFPSILKSTSTSPRSAARLLLVKGRYRRTSRSMVVFLRPMFRLETRFCLASGSPGPRCLVRAISSLA